MQELTLGHKSFTKYMIKHLLMHTIGFYHEQNRQDRDQHIQIFWDDIQNSDKPFFEIRNSTETFDLPYDYNSIMHYLPNSFVKRGSRQTIKPKVSPF